MSENNMLFASRSVCIEKNCAFGLEYSPRPFFAHTKQHSKLQPAHFTAIFLSLAYTKYNEKHSSKPVCFLFYNFISQVNLISAIRWQFTISLIFLTNCTLALFQGMEQLCRELCVNWTTSIH